FDSGARVKKGDVLVEMDTRVEKAQLASAQARRDLAATTADRTRSLVESAAVAAAQLDADESARRAAAADVATLQAQLARKVVRAPFAGTLGIRLVNLGQYLNPGTSLAMLQSTDEEFVDFTLPQQRLAQVQVGTAVRLTLDGDKANPLDGTIAAIEPLVDPSTRSVRLRALPKGGKGKLRPGMFVEVTVVLPVARRVVSVPVTSVVRASFGDSVFVIEPGAGEQAGKQIARQQFVQTGETRGNFVAVDKGLAGTETLVSSGAFKLRNGATIVVDNRVAPAASSTPRPEDR
ncbi:MAG: efflux RND transporter periplasmic adaptor subunit, partial [Myxococcales bacterium]